MIANKWPTQPGGAEDQRDAQAYNDVLREHYGFRQRYVASIADQRWEPLAAGNLTPHLRKMDEDARALAERFEVKRQKWEGAWTQALTLALPVPTEHRIVWRNPASRR